MSKLKQIERMELIEQPLAPRKPFRFQIPQPPRGGQRAVSLVGIDMAYSAHQVYRGLDLTVERGERTVLVGPNGAGKSTLLKILAGVVGFQKGERDLGHNAKVGYFSQHRADTLDPERSVLDEVIASDQRSGDQWFVGKLFAFGDQDGVVIEHPMAAKAVDAVEFQFIIESGTCHHPLERGDTHVGYILEAHVEANGRQDGVDDLIGEA
jgi:energy-coupling factor transporter ATP-binding protein EcfA2